MQRWTTEVHAKRLDRIEHNLAKRRTKDNRRALAKLTEVVDGKRRIVSDPPLIVPLEDPVPAKIYESYRRTLEADRRQLVDRFRVTEVARKVVGVGSVGTQTWIVLLLGRDDEDPLFLQVKEAQSSVLEPFLGGQGYANQGQRVVEGQRLTQAARDLLLGWTRAADADGTERDYYVRQLWHGKASADIEAFDPEAMKLYAEGCGRTLAHSHRPLRGPDCAGGLPRPRQGLRPRARVVRRGLCGSERTRLLRARDSRRRWPGEGRAGPLAEEAARPGELAAHLPQAHVAHAGTGVRGRDHSPSRDHEVDVSAAVREDQVAGPQPAEANRNAERHLPPGRVRDRPADRSVRGVDETRAVEAGAGRDAAPPVRHAELALRESHDPLGRLGRAAGSAARVDLRPGGRREQSGQYEDGKQAAHRAYLGREAPGRKG